MKERFLTGLKLFRWVACFPVAMCLSFLSLPFAMKMFPTVTYGSSIVSKIALTPLILRAAIPAFVFAAAGALVAPGRGRSVCFVFFGLSLVFSAGGLELMSFADAIYANPTFWLAALGGIVLGAVAGLWFSLKMCRSPHKSPNKAPEPTTRSVTSRAIEGNLK